MRISPLLPAGSLLLLFPFALARADTIVQSFPVTFQNTSQTSENTRGFQQFNSALGTLTSVIATFSGDITFIASAPDGHYSLSFDHFAGGGSGQLFFSDSQSNQFQTNVPVDPAAVTAQGPVVNYFIADIDLSVINGTVLGGSSALGTLTYNYTPTAVTPEPSAIALAGISLIGILAAFRTRRARLNCPSA